MSDQDLKQNGQGSSKSEAKETRSHLSNPRFFRTDRWIILAFVILMLSVYFNAHRLRVNIRQQTIFLRSELVIEMHEFSQLQRETFRLNRLLIAQRPLSIDKLALQVDLVQSRITIVEKSLEKRQSNQSRNDSLDADIQAIFQNWATIKHDVFELEQSPEKARLREDITDQLESLEMNINRINLLNNQQHWEEYKLLTENQKNAFNFLILLITSFFLFAALFVLYAIRFAKTREQLLANMKKISITDELTQIANRRYFNQTLALEWNRMMREQSYLAIILCDVDYFKRYNDCYGHQAGDHCLRQIAIALSTITHRAGDLAARYGGEEFTIILPQTSRAAAEHAAARLHTQIAKTAIAHKDSAVSDYVTMSIGIAIGIPGPNISVDHALKRADEALYKAKKNGRNQSCLSVFNNKGLKRWPRIKT